jgi:hypothetical protein
VSEVRGKKYLLVTITSLFIAGLMLMVAPVKAEAFVRVYVDQPQGFISGVPAGDTILINIMIETTGITDGTIDGIVGWGMDVEVDPAVLDVNLVAPPPPPFPPPPPPATAIQGDFLPTYAGWYGLTATLLPGTSDPSTGYWDEISEQIMPSPGHGAGDYTSGLSPLLVTLSVTSKSETAYSKIDLIDVEYMDAAGDWHAVDDVGDGDYNAPVTPEFPLGAAFQVGLIAAVAYVWWTRRHKLKEVP